MSRIGLHIQGSLPNAADLVAQSPAASHLILENPELAEQLARKYPQRIIVSRRDWPDDTLKVPVHSLIAEWRANPHAVHYWPNEPPAGNRAELTTLLGNLVDLMNAGADAGLRLCVGNFAWASILQADDVAAGVWDDFLRNASAWTSDGHGFVGGHEYTTGPLQWGCGGADPNNLMKSGPAPVGPFPSWQHLLSAGASNWLLFRWVPLYQRCQHLGIEMPLMLVTEGFWDRMENLESGGYLAAMDAKAGHKVKGLLSQSVCWPMWWPKSDEETATLAQLKWADATYPDFVRGFHLFACNHDAKWADYDLTAWPGLLDAINKTGD